LKSDDVETLLPSPYANFYPDESKSDLAQFINHFWSVIFFQRIIANLKPVFGFKYILGWVMNIDHQDLFNMHKSHQPYSDRLLYIVPSTWWKFSLPSLRCNLFALAMLCHSYLLPNIFNSSHWDCHLQFNVSYSGWNLCFTNSCILFSFDIDSFIINCVIVIKILSTQKCLNLFATVLNGMLTTLSNWLSGSN